MSATKKLMGHVYAIFTILVWGSCFVLTKELLTAYTAVQIIPLRMGLAYMTLWVLRPKTMKLPWKDELMFILIGSTGGRFYLFLQNPALTYTYAANVSIIVAAAPILTAVLAHFAGEERFRRGTLWGFLVAFTGVVLVVCNGTFVLRLNPRGDFLALGAAACWAVYSVLMRKLGQELDPILVTRRTLFWGILTALPLVLLEGKNYPAAPLLTPAVAGNFLFLGLIGSGLCYVLWNKAFQLLGVVATNNFIYLNPFITIVAARLFLDEPISPLALLGAVLITVGVVVSQREPKLPVRSPAE